MKWAECDTLDELLNLKDKKILTLLEDYRDFSYNVCTPSTALTRLHCIVLFYGINDVYISPWDI